MKNLYKILALQNEKRKKYLENPIFYGRKVKRLVKKLLPDAKIMLFGSVIKGGVTPNSDLDILIISNKSFSNIFEQEKIKIGILKHFPDNPFEIHLITSEQFNGWYSKFIKEDYREM